MVRICYIVLAHENLEHVSSLARLLAQSSEDSQIVIHIDLNSPSNSFDELKKQLVGAHRIHCLENRVRCGWGDFSLVEATLRALRYVREHNLGCDRVILVSGACMPCRPLAELHAFLESNIDRDFIEVHGPEWIFAGMREDRYLYHHFVNHRRSRQLFKILYRFQRWLGLKRSFPEKIAPRFGSQWWALTWSTCAEILSFIDKNPNILNYFKTTWIPDEMFFQTLVNHIVPKNKICSRSLTFYKFNQDGKPFVFGIEHLAIIKRLPFYFVRKISTANSDLRRELTAIASSHAVDHIQPLKPDLPDDFPDRQLLQTLAAGGNKPAD